MTYPEFVARVIAEGELAAKRDYARPDDDFRLAGSLAGFAACLDTNSPPELQRLLAFAQDNLAETILAPVPDTEVHAFASGFHAEITWVCNCVSALLLNEGYPPIIMPTARGVMQCAAILGALIEGRPQRPQWFNDAPDVGTPDCLCSFCGRLIPATTQPIFRVLDRARDLELRCCLDDACTAQLLSGNHGDLVFGPPM